MKTSELTGAQLDYWVAKAMGLPLRNDVWHGDGVFVGHGGGDLTPFAPSTDWAQGGPIIERERIMVTHIPSDEGAVLWLATADAYATEALSGDTPLIAAMRSYVASKFGKELPDT